ncbi:ATP-dependent DNA helicase RecG [Ketobacter alkanivorans]|uniref:ATP-dependent DNA helicase RecG n=1 Tax=Ketobacter alkanivorans TaxID=1917421 RepID=A0A2K9LKM0_9GAMM|nr:ATP-dependent DNA helicase RecG [Ketobacter alkanivorans]AUM12803.1 ATP-dependent DNA helicase RecG [Ketobacter alkanivorans]
MTLSAVTPDFFSSTPVTQLKGVGAAQAEKLARLGIRTLQDVLFHLPFRYQDRTRLVPIGATREGSEVLIQGRVLMADVVIRKRRSLICRIEDGTGQIHLRFFHFSTSQKNHFQPGAIVRCYGEVRLTGMGKEMAHPEYRIMESADAPVEAALTAVYPATEGIQQPTLRKLSDQVLKLLGKAQAVAELLPVEAMHAAQWPSLVEALHYVHRPPADAPVQALLDGSHRAQQRLSLEELTAHHLSLLKLRQRAKAQTSVSLPSASPLEQQLLQGLPFKPTAAQQRVHEEICADLVQNHPMLRLVQGDVGAGKTLVSARAALLAIAAGYQVAMMAPTEILAEQHFHAFVEWFEPLGLRVAWLSGKLKGKKRNEQLALIESGTAHMVVGTHALFQEEVNYRNLALVIIDEQHRFGVHQRLALKQKGEATGVVPHQLIMTATPIPRTLAMSAYADLDTSIIDELPPGRTPVKTVVVESSRRHEVVARVRNACQEGRQVYWVCTLIEESEVLECQAAEDTADQLKKFLPEVRVGLVHGRLKPAEKADIMDQFKKAQIQVLVATTVIEVGVNVPNASVMIIENPERLGLAQLHQLRGRVGRGSTESFCLLMYQKPLSKLGRERLDIMRQTNDGFVIAEKDLHLRGPGEVLGTRQTGEMTFRIANLLRDEGLLEDSKDMAQVLLEKDPARGERLIARWLGNAAQYGEV